MLPFGDFMKSKFFTSLLLATAISSGFSSSPSVSTLAQRNTMVEDALKKGATEDVLKAINEAQQNGQVQTNDQNYVVVIKIVEPGKKYERVAHSKKEKLEEKNRAIESSLEETLKQAEEKLANASGPIPFNFSVNGKTLYAVLFKKDMYIIFNICEKKEEVDALLKPADKPIEKPSETTPPEASAVVTSEKPVEVTSVKATTSDKAVTSDIKPAHLAKDPEIADEKKQDPTTPVTMTSDKPVAPDEKQAETLKESTKTEPPSSEEKSGGAPVVEKKAGPHAAPIKIEGKTDTPKTEVTVPVAAAAA